MPPIQKKKTRSWHFVLTGALGGLAGFVLMEIARFVSGSGDGTSSGELFAAALYFAGFGLAVGAALGLTEGWVHKDRGRLIYGLVLGLVLGAVGGGVGGAIGQGIYGLYPHRFTSGSGRLDLAIVLDSSGSMQELGLWGNDPGGKRRDAANRLVDRLAPADRVAIVDFDDGARAWLPLTPLDSSAARREARRAIDKVDDFGGTNLTAGLDIALQQLFAAPETGRDRHVIFLTDGEGELDATVLIPAVDHGIRIHTIGLGDAIDPTVLQHIADTTGGSYHPVADADDLLSIFDQIYEMSIGAMNEASGAGARDGAELLTPYWVLFVLRVVSWGIVGWLVGLGQGVRENTREDLRACALGGLVGGLAGGALFELALTQLALQSGVLSRFLADVTVGAMIGGSMRMAQAGLVGETTTSLSSVLPEKGGAITFLGPSSSKAVSRED